MQVGVGIWTFCDDGDYDDGDYDYDSANSLVINDYGDDHDELRWFCSSSNSPSMIFCSPGANPSSHIIPMYTILAMTMMIFKIAMIAIMVMA